MCRILPYVNNGERIHHFTKLKTEYTYLFHVDGACCDVHFAMNFEVTFQAGEGFSLEGIVTLTAESHWTMK